MKKIDEQRFKTVLLKIGALYDKSICDILANMWQEDLAEESIDDIEAAFDIYRKGERRAFMPKPGDFLEIINGRPRDNAVVQWGIVQRAASNASCMRFSDPITALVVKDMGGPALGNYTKSDWGMSRAYFIDCYVAHQVQAEVDKTVEKQKLIKSQDEQKKIGGKK